jgi:hypothetical protein
LVKGKYSSVAEGNAGGCMPSYCGGSPSLVRILERFNPMGYEEKMGFPSYFQAVKPRSKIPSGKTQTKHL